MKKEELRVIELETLEQLGDIVRIGKGHENKVPVMKLKRELSDLIGSKQESLVKPTFGLNFQEYTQNVSQKFELSNTETGRGDLSWEEENPNGYVTFISTGDLPLVRIGGGVDEDLVNKPFAGLTCNNFDHIVIKYRSRSIPKETNAQLIAIMVNQKTEEEKTVTLEWAWENSKKWQTIILNAHDIWGRETECVLRDVRLVLFQNDSFVYPDYSIDIAYIQFFNEEYYAELFENSDYEVSEASSGEKLTTEQDKFVYTEGGQFFIGTQYCTPQDRPTYVNNLGIKPSGYYVGTNFVGMQQQTDYLKCYEGEAPFGHWSFESGAEGEACVLFRNSGSTINDNERRVTSLGIRGWCNPSKTSDIGDFAHCGWAIESFICGINGKWLTKDNGDIELFLPGPNEGLIEALANEPGGSAQARRYEINIPLSKLPDNMYDIVIAVILTQEGRHVIYELSKWGTIKFNKKTQFCDIFGNSYWVESDGTLKKNNEITNEVKYVSYYQDANSKFLSFDPQINLVSEVVDGSYIFSYPDKPLIFTLKTPEPFYSRLPNATLMPITITEDGTYKAEMPADGYNEITVNVSGSADGKNRFIDLLNDATGSTITGEVVMPEESQKIVYNKFSLAGITHLRQRAFQADIFVKELQFDEGLLSMGDYSCADCISLEKVEIPETIEKIGTGVFQNSAVKIIKIYSVEPPIITDVETIPAGCKIYVPKDGLEKYTSNKNWSKVTDKIYSM